MTFLIGTVSSIETTRIDTRLVASVVEDENIFPIKACDLLEAPGRFVGKRVSVRATVYHVLWNNLSESADFIIVYPLNGELCDGFLIEPLVNTELDLRNYFGPVSNLKDILGPFENELDVQIVGVVTKVSRADSIRRYALEPESIQVISPLREFTPKGAA